MKTTIAIFFGLLMVLTLLVRYDPCLAVMYGTSANPIYAKITSLREEFPNAVLTSWCRSVEYNRAVGGVEGSRHISCMAVDMVVPEEKEKRFVERARSLGFHVLIESDHVHLEYR